MNYSFIRDSEARPVFGTGTLPTVTGEMGIPVGTTFFDVPTLALYYWSGSAWTPVYPIGTPKRMNWYSDIPGGGAGGTSTYGPFYLSILASGVLTLVPEANHPGVALLTSSVSANSGGVIWTAQQNGLLLSGSEHFCFVFKQARFTDVVHIAGFHDILTATTVVDGVYFSVSAAGAMTGVCTSNSTSTSTGSSYTLSLATWYRGEIQLNDDATRATFYLYDSATGTQLWKDSVTTNIPKTAGRETGVGWIIYHTGTAAYDLGSLDFIQADIRTTLVR